MPRRISFKKNISKKKSSKKRKIKKNNKYKGGFLFWKKKDDSKGKWWSDEERFKKYGKEIKNIQKRKIPDYMFVNGKSKSLNQAVIDLINFNLPETAWGVKINTDNGKSIEMFDLYWDKTINGDTLKWKDWLLLNYRKKDLFVYGIPHFNAENNGDIRLYKFGKNYKEDTDGSSSFNFFYEGDDGYAYISNGERTFTIFTKNSEKFLLKKLNIKFKKRPSPLISAKKFKIGEEKVGYDGNIWEVIKLKNGVKRWVKQK